MRERKPYQSGDISPYADLLYLPHPVSQKHQPMSRQDRAAQFSPFAALSGYEAALQEAGRLTDRRMELDEEEKEKIRGRLQTVQDNIETHPEVSFVYFVPDVKKEGGAYASATDRVKRLDEFSRMVILMDGRTIPMDEIVDVQGECLRDTEDV